MASLFILAASTLTDFTFALTSPHPVIPAAMATPATALPAVVQHPAGGLYHG
jgi:hypothetical protein